MTAVPETSRPKLAWALRRYIWQAIAVVIVICAAVSLVGASGSSNYQAHALVVVSQTALEQGQLPRLATSVFNSGEVASAVIEKEHLNLKPDQLIPGRVSVVPFSDTVLFQVNANASHARDAENLANDAADAFVDQLNKAGPKFVGTFKVQEAAEEPSHPSSSPRSIPVLVVVGLIGGVAIALLGLVLFLALRRPVTSETDITQLLHLPVLGTLTFPRKAPFTPERVGGIRRVTRALHADPDGAHSVAAIPCGGDWALSEAVSRLLGTGRNMRYAAYGQFRAAAARRATAAAAAEPESRDRSIFVANVPPESTENRHVTIVGGFPIDGTDETPESLLEPDARVLIVPIGLAESAVLESARRFANGELDSVVCVDRQARRSKS